MKTLAEKSFFLFLLTAALLFPCSGAETVVIYRSSSEVSLSASTPLRRLEQFLKELFPKTPYPKSPLTIDITGRGTPPEAASGNVLQVDFFRLQRESLTLYAEAGGAMLHAWGKAPAGFRLPLFLCGAFRHRERAAANECRFLGNNRRLSSIEAVLRHGQVPDLKKILKHRVDERDRTANEWFDDHARLLLELLRRRGFRGKAEELRGAAEKLLAGELKTEELVPMIWGNFNLLPPELAEQELSRMLTVEIPRLDYMNEPNGLTETASASQLPAKVLKHPMRKEICRQFGSSLLRQSVKLPSGFRPRLRQLHDAALLLGKSPAFEPDFRSALAQLEKFCRSYAARGAALDKLQSETHQPVRMWKRSLTTNGQPGTIIPPESSRFLDRMEEYYTGI